MHTHLRDGPSVCLRRFDTFSDTDCCCFFSRVAARGAFALPNGCYHLGVGAGKWFSLSGQSLRPCPGLPIGAQGALLVPGGALGWAGSRRGGDLVGPGAEHGQLRHLGNPAGVSARCRLAGQWPRRPWRWRPQRPLREAGGSGGQVGFWTGGTGTGESSGSAYGPPVGRRTRPAALSPWSV